MIIPAETQVQKTPLLASNSRTDSPPPPAYGAQEQSPPLNSTRIPSRPQSYDNIFASRAELDRDTESGRPSVNDRNKRAVGRAARSRFCRALAIASLIWVVAVVVIRFQVRISRRKNPFINGDLPDIYDKPHDVEIERCISNWSPLSGVQNKGTQYSLGSTGRHEPKATIVAPLSSDDMLFFLSRGASQKGSIRFTSSSLLDDTAEVKVIAEASNYTLLQDAKFCALRKAGTERSTGMGLFTPRHPKSPQDFITFQVVVHLPQAMRHPIKNLETDFQNYNVAFEYLDFIIFEKLYILTTNSPVFISALNVKRGMIRTSSGSIDGSIRVEDCLELRTKDKPITTKIDLVHRVGGRGNISLEMINSNGPIQCDLRLSSQLPTGVTYDVEAATTKHAVDLRYLSQPVDSTLLTNVITRDARASVYMDPAFEGRYDVATSSIDEIEIEQRTRSRRHDPSGRKRERVMDIWKDSENGTGGWKGFVTWGNKTNEELKSSVTIRTRSAPVELSF